MGHMALTLVTWSLTSHMDGTITGSHSGHMTISSHMILTDNITLTIHMAITGHMV